MADKVKAILVLWASIAFSIWFVSGKLWLTLLLLAIATGVSIHLLRLPTYRPENSPENLTAADKAV